jgi:redox-sensitive bicupin YhaK (pirin superfamily)
LCNLTICLYSITKATKDVNMCGSELHSLRSIKVVIPTPYHAFDSHSGAFMLRAEPADISPFIGTDLFTMPQPFFGPHPHAGMSAVTLMLPEAEGGFVNRDSLGDHSTIHPGDLHWTQAGRGMMHEEVPKAPGKAAQGFQIFVNLAAAHKQSDPVAFHINSADIPVVPVDGGSVRVVAGQFDGQSSPISHDARWLTQVNILDVTLQAGAKLNIPVAAGDNAFFVIYSGSFDAPERVDTAQAAIVFAADGAMAQLRAGSQNLRGVFFSGTPIDEPMFPKGPFMGNTAHDVAQYSARFQRGEMGTLSKSF